MGQKSFRRHEMAYFKKYFLAASSISRDQKNVSAMKQTPLFV